MANQIVDLGDTSFFCPSLVGVNPASGVTIGYFVDLKDADSFCNVWVASTACSGEIVLQIQTTDQVSGAIWSGGGPLSGAFTDPTSGLASTLSTYNNPTFPTTFLSGGILIVNSGLYAIPGGAGPVFAASGVTNPLSGGGSATPYQGGFPQGTYPLGYTPLIQSMGAPLYINLSGAVAPRFASGGMQIAGFQRPNRFARINVVSGSSTTIIAGFLSQFDTTGSEVGAGFSWQPSAGSGTGTGAGGIGMPVV